MFCRKFTATRSLPLCIAASISLMVGSNQNSATCLFAGATTRASAEESSRSEIYHQGLELQKAGHLKDAAAKFEAATGEGYEYAPALNHFCWFLSANADEAFRDAKRAVPLGERAVTAAKAAQDVKMSGDCLDTLAVAYAESGDFAKAVELETAALEIAKGEKSRDRIHAFSDRLDLFQKRTPYHDKPK